MKISSFFFYCSNSCEASAEAKVRAVTGDKNL
nr:MAG TPA: E3 ubiquitin-protein ligase [Caudoviricetes sp.]